MTTQALLSDAELLARLVAFDSTSRNSNIPIADFIADYLDRPGVRVERQFSPDGERVNLVVLAGPDVDPESRGGLLLSGHMDVVPADEPEWTSDPFQLRETDDAFYGRGAVDMKGFVALAVNLAARCEPAQLRRPLALVLTYDEELGTIGAGHFAVHWPMDEKPLPRNAVIGEPTSMQAVRMHKGHTSLRFEVRGRSAHSGYPHLGRNAVVPAARAVGVLESIRRKLVQEGGPNQEYFPDTPFVALNAAQINGGRAINIVPDHCIVHLGFRLLPGMERETMVERIRQRLAAVLDGEEWSFELLQEAPPLLLGEDAEIYRAVCELIGQKETISASYATDGGWMATAGLDCVIWGPGTIEVAHKPNEWMPKDEFQRTVPLLEKLLERFCMENDT